MKKLVTATLVLGSFSSFAASNMVIENLTYPSQKMEVKCLDQNCESIDVNVIDENKSIRLIVNKRIVQETISNRRKIKEGRSTYRHAYSMTSKAAKNTSDRYKEAYYGKAVGNSLLTVGASILDTVILPVDLLSEALSYRKLDSAKDKKGAITLLNNLESDLSRVILKEKYYRRVVEYVQSIGQLSVEGHELLKSFANYEYHNCHIILKRDGWANQLYINDTFSGNYDSNSAEETVKLVERLSQLIKLGTCY